MKIKKTLSNPHQLTGKQQLVIAEVINNIKTTGKAKISEAHHKVYDAKSKQVSMSIRSENLQKPNFRQALIDALHSKEIIGVNGKINNVLAEGMDALNNKGQADHKTRLAYVQEVNKIIGAYGAKKVESKSMNLNIDMSQEELQDNINKLQAELGYTEKS